MTQDGPNPTPLARTPRHGVLIVNTNSRHGKAQFASAQTAVCEEGDHQVVALAPPAALPLPDVAALGHAKQPRELALVEHVWECLALLRRA